MIIYLVFRIDIIKVSGLAEVWGENIGSDDMLLFIMFAPLVNTPFSLLHYKSREPVYKAWLYTTATALILFIGLLFLNIIDSPGSAGVISLAGIEFALLAAVYIGISFIIWLYGAITHFFRK